MTYPMQFKYMRDFHVFTNYDACLIPNIFWVLIDQGSGFLTAFGKADIIINLCRVCLKKPIKVVKFQWLNL